MNYRHHITDYSCPYCRFVEPSHSWVDTKEERVDVEDSNERYKVRICHRCKMNHEKYDKILNPIVSTWVVLLVISGLGYLVNWINPSSIVTYIIMGSMGLAACIFGLMIFFYPALSIVCRTRHYVSYERAERCNAIEPPGLYTVK